MDADSWSARLSSASRRYQSVLQSRSDMLMGFEEIDGDDDIREEFPCPFCSEYYDIVGLCCHIDDEHPTEAKNGGVRLELYTGDKKGLLACVTRTFRENGINATSAEISTSTDMARNVFYVTDSMGYPADAMDWL